MSPELYNILSEAGVAGVALGVMAWLFTKMMQTHKKERDEFRADIKDDREKANTILAELTTVIRHNNRLLDKFEKDDNQTRNGL